MVGPIRRTVRCAMKPMTDIRNPRNAKRDLEPIFRFDGRNPVYLREEESRRKQSLARERGRGKKSEANRCSFHTRALGHLEICEDVMKKVYARM